MAVEEGTPNTIELGRPMASSRPRQVRNCFKRPRMVFVVANTALLALAATVLVFFLLGKGAQSGFFACKSPNTLGNAAATQHKGLAVDDATFLGCPDKIPSVWPNANAPVSSIRFFKAWDTSWPDAQRRDAWKSIANYAIHNNVKVLLGTGITCSEDEDDADWANVLQLLKMLGPDHVMGVAIGNELELLQFKDKKIVPDSCVQKVWGGGYFLRKFDERAHDLDTLGGFSHIPLTSAFGGTIMTDDPFWNTPKAMVLDFFQKVTAKYGTRFVYSLNIYPYFDPSNTLDPGSSNTCTQALKRSLCWDDPSACLFASLVKSMRQRMKEVSSSNNILWITETGWSSPASDTLRDKKIYPCTAFSSKETMWQYYQGFLQWDLQVDGAVGPDHIFYFTVRDSNNFGQGEFFGLIEDCHTSQCKLGQSSVSQAKPLLRPLQHLQFYNDTQSAPMTHAARALGS